VSSKALQAVCRGAESCLQLSFPTTSREIRALDQLRFNIAPALSSFTHFQPWCASFQTVSDAFGLFVVMFCIYFSRSEHGTSRLKMIETFLPNTWYPNSFARELHFRISFCNVDTSLDPLSLPDHPFSPSFISLVVCCSQAYFGHRCRGPDRLFDCSHDLLR
jgi:hypothetical protein